jgi:phage-related protein
MFKVIYYSKNGKIPIVDFLKTLPNKDQVKILREIDLLEQYGFSLGMPYIKKMKDSDGLWELRIKQSSNNYRVFYFSFTDNKFVLLHGFKKKTQKTPKKEIELALRRKQDFLERNDD